MSIEYAVVFEKFAESHYIKLFEKKHKKGWAITRQAVTAELQRIEALIGRNAYIEVICDRDGIKILKMEFRVAGTQESRHGSGNRCIIALREEISTAFVLLVYGKTDVRGSRETDWWKAMIREHYPEYGKLF